MTFVITAESQQVIGEQATIDAPRIRELRLAGTQNRFVVSVGPREHLGCSVRNKIEVSNDYL